MLSAYKDAIQQHINESCQDLEELNQILQTRNWSRLERKGAERLIQTLVEACIGIAKHWLKQQGKVLPSDAYSVFETLTELQLIPNSETEQWQKVIGMRNAIVHDYLNLDERVIKAIITQKMYLQLQDFALTTSNRLE